MKTQPASQGIGGLTSEAWRHIIIEVRLPESQPFNQTAQEFIMLGNPTQFPDYVGILQPKIGLAKDELDIGKHIEALVE